MRWLATLLVVAMAAGGSLLAPAGAEGRREGVAALLDRRAEALQNRDRAAYLDTISPLASGEFRRSQANAFDRMAEVPLAHYSLKARWDVYGDLVRPRDRRLYPAADDVTIPVTQERLRIEGYDVSPAVEDLYLTFVLHEGRWGIADDDDLEDLGLLSARRIWDLGPVAIERNDHFLLLHHPARSVPSGTLALAEDALDEVDLFWGARWSRRVPIIMPVGEEDLKRMLQITVDLSEFVAFAYSNINDRGDPYYSGTRIVLNPDALAGRSRESIFGVLAHELAHASALSHSGPFVPLWVEEGLAEQVRHEGDAGELAFLTSRSNLVDDRLPRDVEFQIGHPDDVFLAYQEAYSAVRFFIERHGLESFRRFYRRLGRVRLAFGTPRHHVNRALRAITGDSLREFERAWAGSIDSL